MSRYRKALVALGGAALQALAYAATAADSGLLPEAWRPWASVVIALATALGVYRVPNATEGAVGRLVREALDDDPPRHAYPPHL